MKIVLPILMVSIVLAVCPPVFAQNPSTAAEAPQVTSLEEGGRDGTQALETRFAATLKNATFNGRWCLIQEGKMGPEKEDKYTIIEARKVGGDTWLIHTRVQYGDRDFVAPLPVQVKWAGDTAVIVVDNLAMPGGTRAYSARVVIHQDTYAGSWSGGDHAGLLMGVITRSGVTSDE